MSRKLLRLLGIGLFFHVAAVAENYVRYVHEGRTLCLAVVAPDASRHSLDKVVPMLRAKNIRVIEGPSATELGAAFGRESTAAVGVVDPQLASGIRALVESAPPGGHAADSIRAR